MDIARVQFVSLPVADHRRARDFYVQVLGFEVLIDRLGPHGQFVMVAPPGAETGLVLVDFGVGVDPAGSVHLQLISKDVAGDAARLREAGVTVTEPMEMPWGRAVSFTDPDGNALGLLEPSRFGNAPAENFPR